MTLAQFNALAKQYNQEQDWLNYRSALVCSVIAEVNRDPKRRKRPFTSDDFMPKKKSKDVGRLTSNEILERLRALNTILGGKEVRKDGSV